MGSNATSGGVGTPPSSSRIVAVGTNSRNVDLLTDALTGYEVTPATEPADLDPVFAGAVAADLVVVDTETVDDSVTALVERLLAEDISVVLLAEEASPAVRTDAAAVDGLAFREKPVRSADLRTMVGDALD